MRYGIEVQLLALLALVTPAIAQGTPQKPSQKIKAAQPSPKWIDDKISVTVGQPYLSDAGRIVLVYTVTNKARGDVRIDFIEKPLLIPGQPEPTRVFLMLKSNKNHVQVMPKDQYLHFFDELIPEDLPVLFRIVVGAGHETKASWFSAETSADKLRQAISKELGNTEAIIVFIPERRPKIVFPIPKG